MQPADAPRAETPGANPPRTDGGGGDALPACLCAAVTALAFFLTWPFVEMPFSDDWSYAFTARQLARSGHLRYNGWAAPALIPQAYWGATIIHFSGFSFTALRMGTLPLAMGCAAICYLLARRCELRPCPAVLASLTMALSPIFLPLATSFMTDVPSLLFTLLSLYALIRCGQSVLPAGRLGWLALGALAGIIGGMNRQVVWLLPLAIVPCLMLVRGRDFGLPFLLAAAAGWIIVAADALATVQWFDAQPYTVAIAPLKVSLEWILHRPRRLWETAIAMWLTTAMLALPAMLPASAAAARKLVLGWKTPRVLATVIVTLAVVASFLSCYPRFLEMLWLGNMVRPTGILGNVEVIGHRPVVLPWWFREGCGTAIWVMTAILLAEIAASLPCSRVAIKKFCRSLVNDRLANCCMGIFAAVYVIAVLSRSGFDLVFDRYLLPMSPLLAIALLRWWQRAPLSINFRRITWRAGLILLGIQAAFAVAATQEVLALGRARLEALADLQNAGVPPGDVLAGVEQIGWTLLEANGHLSPRQAAILDSPAPYEVDESGKIKSLADYLVEASPDPRPRATRLGEVGYFSLLPPMNRTIYIYRAPPRQSSH